MSSVTLQLLLELTLLVCYTPVATDAASTLNKTIHIGYFMTSDPYRAAAINLAIEQAQDEGLFSQYNYR